MQLVLYQRRQSIMAFAVMWSSMTAREWGIGLKVRTPPRMANFIEFPLDMFRQKRYQATVTVLARHNVLRPSPNFIRQ